MTKNTLLFLNSVVSMSLIPLDLTMVSFYGKVLKCQYLLVPQRIPYVQYNASRMAKGNAGLTVNIRKQ